MTINSCTIKCLFDTMAKEIFVTQDNRYIGTLPNIELEYYDEIVGQVKWGQVEFIQKHFIDKPMFKISFKSGDYVEITEDHSLVVKRDNKLIQTKVYQLQNGDQFFTINGWVEIETIVPLERHANWVYDIQMKDNPHTFFAHGVLVHNSVFLKLSKSKQDTIKFLEIFNKEILLNGLIKKFNPFVNIDYFLYELQYQKDLDYIYFSDRKKRYYAIENTGEKYVHGLNIIHKDTPKFIKELLDQLCEKAVKNGIVLEDLKETFQKLKTADYKNIAVHKTFTKKFSQYNKMIPQHVAGALYANQHLNLKIKHSDVVFLFYINSFCEPDIKVKDRKNVICLREQDFGVIKESGKFEIDYVQLMEKQIIQPLREFDKIPIVEQTINEWCKLMEDNYRFSKIKGYVFKKR